MRVIEEKIISSLKNIQMDVEQGYAVDSYTVLSRSDYNYKGEPRDIILYEDNCIKYKLFNTTLYLYDFGTGLHKVLCRTYSNTTASRVKALLTMDPAITDIHIKNGKYCIKKNYDRIETITKGGIYEW